MSRAPHLIRSSFLVFFIFGLDKITGFVKLLLTTRLFGTGPEVDAFATANQLPELLLALLAAGALSAAFIPVYSGYLTQSRRREAESLAGTVLTLTLIVMGTACLLAIAAAPWLIPRGTGAPFSPGNAATHHADDAYFPAGRRFDQRFRRLRQRAPFAPTFSDTCAGARSNRPGTDRGLVRARSNLGRLRHGVGQRIGRGADRSRATTCSGTTAPAPAVTDQSAAARCTGRTAPYGGRAS